jgi:hypothetical protein
MKKLICLLILSVPVVFSQVTETPLEMNNYDSLTSYSQMLSYLYKIVEEDSRIKMEFIGESVEGRKIPVVSISSSDFGEDSSKVKILIFAQQHGNEQSGKEGALLLLKDIVSGEFDEFLGNSDLLLVPQMNPDGASKNERRNGNNADLNRNHLILTQPEVIGLHKLFNRYLPEATLDVHEYYPYSDDWIKFGYLKDSDEQFGTTTDINVSEKIRRYSSMEFLPFAKNYLKERGFSFNNYILGGPPGENRMRHSTVDINDGRQSFGILNSFSFILEGKNGRDQKIENIRHRAEGQKTAMQAFISFVSQNRKKIKNLVNNERNKLIHSKQGKPVAVRMEHIKGDSVLSLSLKSVYSGRDTFLTVEEYHSVVEPLLNINKPLGYLIPRDSVGLLKMLQNHNIKIEPYKQNINERFERYYIEKVDSVLLEELMLPDAVLRIEEVSELLPESYSFIPINQLNSNMLVLALEPQSMIGIVVYDEYRNWIAAGKYYPIIRVLRKN